MYAGPEEFKRDFPDMMMHFICFLQKFLLVYTSVLVINYFHPLLTNPPKKGSSSYSRRWLNIVRSQEHITCMHYKRRTCPELQCTKTAPSAWLRPNNLCARRAVTPSANRVSRRGAFAPRNAPCAAEPWPKTRQKSRVYFATCSLFSTLFS